MGWLQRPSTLSENGGAAGGQEDLWPGLDQKWKNASLNMCMVCLGSGWCSTGAAGIKCLLGSLVNVSNLTLLGRGGRGADGWGREGTQETRRPSTINILDPGASPFPSWG